MFLLQNSGVSTAQYQSDSAIPLDEVGEHIQADDVSANEPCFEDLREFLDCTKPDGDPLLFAYDCEATGEAFMRTTLLRWQQWLLLQITQQSLKHLFLSSAKPLVLFVHVVIIKGHYYILCSLLTAKTLSGINILSLLSKDLLIWFFQNFCTGALRKSMNHPRRHFIQLFCLDVSHCNINFKTTVLVAHNSFTYDF